MYTTYTKAISTFSHRCAFYFAFDFSYRSATFHSYYIKMKEWTSNFCIIRWTHGTYFDSLRRRKKNLHSIEFRRRDLLLCNSRTITINGEWWQRNTYTRRLTTMEHIYYFWVKCFFFSFENGNRKRIEENHSTAQHTHMLGINGAKMRDTDRPHIVA